MKAAPLGATEASLARIGNSNRCIIFSFCFLMAIIYHPFARTINNYYRTISKENMRRCISFTLALISPPSPFILSPGERKWHPASFGFSIEYPANPMHEV